MTTWLVRFFGIVERTRPRWAAVLIFVTSVWFAAPVSAVEHVSVKRDGKSFSVVGKVLTEAEDGGLLMLDQDGVIWAIQPAEISERRKDDEPFQANSREAAMEKLLAELPAGFKIHKTAHYIIGYNTTKAYAEWCGSLYERLYRGFHTYWENRERGFDLHEPDFPLVALVFDRKESYERVVRAELGAATERIVAYYSQISNRIHLYDLTGIEEFRAGKDRGSTSARVNEILSMPAAAPMVATIVHEATHQLAYNCGLQTRVADNPLWVSEGLAMFFETPDLKNAKGWSNIGNINRNRLIQFRKYLQNRPVDSLVTLVQDDKRFINDQQIAEIAYAEAWALNYYLLKGNSKQAKHFFSYLKQLLGKPPSVYDTPEERLNLFRSEFGEDLKKFDAEFVRYVKQLK